MIEGLGKGLLRCGYCHGEAHGLLEGCSECGILLHADCRRALGRCPTLGCLNPSVQAPLLALQRPPAPAPEEAPPLAHAVADREDADTEGALSEDEIPGPPRALSGVPQPRWARIRRAGFSGLLLSLHRAVLPLAVLSALLMGAYTLVDAFAHTYRSSEVEAGGVSPKVVRDACRRFRASEGRWPESLEELVVSKGEAYLEAWPTSSAGEDFVLLYRGREAWLGTQLSGTGSLELHVRLFVKPIPVAACGLPPQSAHVRAHQLTRGSNVRK